MQIKESYLLKGFVAQRVVAHDCLSMRGVGTPHENERSQHEISCPVEHRHISWIYAKHLIGSEQVFVNIPIVFTQKELHFLKVGFGHEIVRVDTREHDFLRVDTLPFKNVFHFDEAMLLVRGLTRGLSFLEGVNCVGKQSKARRKLFLQLFSFQLGIGRPLLNCKKYHVVLLCFSVRGKKV